MQRPILTFSVIVGVALAAGLAGVLLPGVTTLAQRPADLALPAPEEFQKLAVPQGVAAPSEEQALQAPSEVSSKGLLIEDPERAAEEFVERTRQEADDAVRTLTEEAELLRARLQKVEAGLGRWQALLNAIDGSNATLVEPLAMPYGTGYEPVQN